jgi:heptosyltransferase-1
VHAAHFDLVIDLQRHLKSGIIGLVSGARDRLGFAAPNTKEFNHHFTTRQIEPQSNLRSKLIQYQAFADALGVSSAPIEFGLSLPPAEDADARAAITTVRRPLVGVILGSSWPSRVYFPESVAEVIRELAQPANGAAPLYPVLIGAREDAAIGDAVMRNLDGLPALNLVGRTRLRDLIGIFRQCAVSFGPDSGPMHIAAAVGCPVVSLWGATAAQRSAPWGYADLALSAAIPCHPCYLRDCPIGRECMRRIAPAEVVAMVRRALSRRIDAVSGDPPRASIADDSNAAAKVVAPAPVRS